MKNPVTSTPFLRKSFDVNNSIIYNANTQRGIKKSRTMFSFEHPLNVKRAVESNEGSQSTEFRQTKKSVVLFLEKV